MQTVSRSLAHTLDEKVEADKIRLLYDQSFQGVFSSGVAAGIWSALMWKHADHHALLIWIGAVLAVTLLRTLVFVSYRRQATPATVHWWRLPYGASVLLSASVWGVGTLWVTPADNVLMLVCTYVFLVGLAGAALSAYGVFMGLTIGIVSAVLLPITIYFALHESTALHFLAAGGIWFFVTTLRAITIHNARLGESFRRGHELTEAKLIAERQARTDALTGLNNRRAFNDTCDALLRVAAREKKPATMLVFDIDDFKQINDAHGHAIGDAALLHLTAVLSASLRASDVCGRLGGDEFAVLLPNTTLTAGREVAEKIRTALTASPLPVNAIDVPLTLSIGIAADSLDAEALLNHADAQMYAAKRAGKNQLVG